MWEQSCDAIATYVRDDNAPSWSTLVHKNGFVRTSLPKMAQALGLSATMKLFFSNVYGFALGYEYYIALPGQVDTRRLEKKSTIRQICAYLLFHLALLAPALVKSEHKLSLAAAFGVVFAGNMLAGYLGTLFSFRRKWRFRQPGGGIFICLINMASGIFFPLCGNWYPAQYENTPRFRRDLALSSICTWIFLLAVTASSFFLSAPIFAYTAGIAFILLVLRCIPVPPFGPYGGWRVFRWNKIVFALLAAATAAAIIMLFI